MYQRRTLIEHTPKGNCGEDSVGHWNPESALSSSYLFPTARLYGDIKRSVGSAVCSITGAVTAVDHSSESMRMPYFPKGPPEACGCCY